MSPPEVIRAQKRKWWAKNGRAWRQGRHVAGQAELRELRQRLGLSQTERRQRSRSRPLDRVSMGTRPSPADTPIWRLASSAGGQAMSPPRQPGYSLYKRDLEFVKLAPRPAPPSGCLNLDCRWFPSGSAHVGPCIPRSDAR